MAAKEYREAHAAYLAERERRGNFDRANGLSRIIKPLARREEKEYRKTTPGGKAKAHAADYRDQAIF